MSSTPPTTSPTGSSSGGLLLALISAASFGLSGSLGKGLIDAGWSPGAAVCARILIAAAALLVPTVLAVRGRWTEFVQGLPLVASYGLVAVAGCQLAYFNAVEHMPVAVALLVEYTSPVAVIAWLWLRHGHRPNGRIVLGAVLALSGLVLVLDLFAGTRVSSVGLAWAFGAMVGGAAYFLLSANDSGVPPLALAGGGLLIGGLALGICGLTGLVRFTATRRPVDLAGSQVAWWVPLLALGVVTAAIAYVTGIQASRRLGSRLASFVALGEVLFSMAYAVWLLDETPRPVQFAGGALVLAGVIAVKLGEDES